MRTPSEITGLVLAGGQSRRFGRDKALATHDGRPFVQIVHDALAAHCAEVLIATGPTARDYPVLARTVLDPVPEGGPLAGLAAGLAEAQTPWLLAVAVDLPGLTPDALMPLIASSTEADAVVALDEAGRRQPVCALWRCATVRPVVEARLAGRQLALFGLLDALAVHEVGLAAGALRNVNAPEAKGRRAPTARAVRSLPRLPSNAMLTLDLPPSVDEARARLILAVGLFQEDEVSVGRAAEIAGLSYRDFLDALRARGVPAYTYTDEMLEEDLAFVRRFKEARGL